MMMTKRDTLDTALVLFLVFCTLLGGVTAVAIRLGFVEF